MNPRLQFLESQIQRLTFLPPLIARLCLGVVFLQSGIGKLSHLSQAVEFFSSLGIPAPSIQAPMIAGLELLGGFALLLGVGSRGASVLLSGTMVVAILTAKRSELQSPSDLFGLVEFTYLALLAYVAVGGPGKLSLSQLLPGNKERSVLA